jgi:hydroxymethylpyrimidine pyrophosphatase-like HAD family hydrolase
MSDYFRAVALDYDGTIAFGARPDEVVLAALRKVREASCRTLLVTGRILSELEIEFPDVYQHFDAIVAENGAVVWQDGRQRAVATPVPTVLEQALAEQSIPVRRGMVILATDAVHDQSVRDTTVRLGLDEQLVRNRGALMVLPAGVTKGTGLHEALAELGVSYHSTVGFGDAENDIALLEACEIGVALGNAVPSLREYADIVLPDFGGAVIARFLEERFLRDFRSIQPRRRRIELGLTEQGTIASVPASRVQVFIDGPSGAGKSYLAGLFAENLFHSGYTLCVLDLEGDHAALGQLRGVLTLGGREPLPSLDELARFVRHRFSSLVLDLSMRDPGLKYAYARDVLERLTEVRRECGLPHWIMIEEAHVVPSEALDRAREHGSLCLVTYHPDWLPASAVGSSDILITVEAPGRARMRSGNRAHAETIFRPAKRELAHVRHRRKYAESQVPYERGFTFRNSSGSIGPHVVCLRDFGSELARVPASSIAHHAGRHDFSRWIRDVFQDQRLTVAVRRAEDAFRSEDVEHFRATLRDLVSLRYGIDSDAPPLSSSQGSAVTLDPVSSPSGFTT